MQLALTSSRPQAPEPSGGIFRSHVEGFEGFFWGASAW